MSSMVDCHRFRLCRFSDHYPPETANQSENQVRVVGHHGFRDSVGGSAALPDCV